MIYPILTEFEWGIAAIVIFFIVIVGVKAVIREEREGEPHEPSPESREEFHRYIEEEIKKVEERKAEFEKERFGESGNPYTN